MPTERNLELPIERIINALITREAAPIQTEVVVNQLPRRPGPRTRIRDTVLDVLVKRIEEIQGLVHGDLSSLDITLTHLA
jgi:hypothetical protein